MIRRQGGLVGSLLLMLFWLVTAFVTAQALAVDTSEFQTATLLDQYKDEEKVCNGWLQESGCCKKEELEPLMIRYFDDKERAQYKLAFKNGKVYQGGKMLPHLRADEDPNSEVDYMYTMDKQGNIYAYENGPLASCRVHHSSFVEGGPVTGAGHIRVQKGAVTFASNCSGHYHPPDVLLDQVLEVLSGNGIEVKEKNYYGGKPMKAYRY